jgi:hydroxymethylpyrimidine/phosphomethylpyrimidine kinase
MVMQEAIKDKTIQVEQKIKDQEGQLHDVSAKSDLLHGHHHEDDDDEDDAFGDDEEEKIMRNIRERRLQNMKNVY